MTNEWIDWTGENHRIRTPLRAGACSNYLNNNYTNHKMNGMGFKVHSMMMKSLQRPKGIHFVLTRFGSRLSIPQFHCN